MNLSKTGRLALTTATAGVMVGLALLNGGSAQSIGGLCNGRPASHTWLDASGQYGPALIDGTDHDDTIIGSDGDDTIDAGDGDDVVCGGRRLHRRGGDDAPPSRPAVCRRWHPAAAPAVTPFMAIATVNPATGEMIQTFDPLTAEEIDAELARSADGVPTYRLTTFAERAALACAGRRPARREADAIAADDDHRDGQDAGVGQGRGRKCAMACRFYAEHAEAFLRRRAGRPGRRRTPRRPSSATSRSARCSR